MNPHMHCEMLQSKRSYELQHTSEKFWHYLRHNNDYNKYYKKSQHIFSGNSFMSSASYS